MYRRRLSSPSLSGHSNTQGRRNISDVSRICPAGLTSATFTSDRHACAMDKDVHRGNIDRAVALAVEDGKLLATSCKQQKHSVSPPFQRNARYTTAVKIQVLRQFSKTRKGIQPSSYGRYHVSQA